MKRQDHFAIPVKLWAFVCVLVGISLTANGLYTIALMACGFLHLGLQRSWRVIRSCGVFYILLLLLLCAIRYFGLHMVIFSEFHVLMFWTLSPVFLISWDLITTPPGEISAFLSGSHVPTSVILAVLVLFRFIPTIRSEWREVGRSMRNRGLTRFKGIMCHPFSTCEYVLVPLLLRVLQMADQLAVSAVVRGIERPGRRSSYYGTPLCIRDWLMLLCWTAASTGVLLLGGVR